MYLQDIAKKRQLAIVDKEEEATHILHPVAEANDESYARAVFKCGEKCLVHFYRFPESRDNWGTLYPPEDKDPPEFGEEPYREEQASYPTYTQYWFAQDAMEIFETYTTSYHL